MIRNFGAVKGIDLQSKGIDLGFGGGGAAIKSVQRGGNAMSSSLTTMDVTISAVDLTKAYVLIEIVSDSNVYVPSQYMVSAKFTANNKLTFTRTGTSGGPVSFYWTVVEFESGVSVQRGSGSWVGYVGSPQNSNTINISSIAPSKSFVVLNYRTNTTSHEKHFTNLLVQNLNATNFAIYSPYAYNDNPSLVYEWQVVTFL